MPFTEQYPFYRVCVDYRVRGLSRIWWEHHPGFVSSDTDTYQLQWGRTDNPNATDWQDIGVAAVLDKCELEDDAEKLMTGKNMLVFYRVVLRTPTCTYRSLPASIYGQLTRVELKVTRTIIRKERLRFERTGRPMLLLKRKVFGIACSRCTDLPSDQPTDSRCPECYGTGFRGGYHPPTPTFCMDLDPEAIIPQRNGAQGPGQYQPRVTRGRALGSPRMDLEDILVDTRSDARFYVNTVTRVADIKGIPLIVQPELRFIDFADVAYRIPIGGEINDDETAILPKVGGGCVVVDHDYGGEDALAYVTDGCDVVGATILIFTAAAYSAGARTADEAYAISSTTANGRWEFAVNLDPGEYVVVFSLLGAYGPDAVNLTVAAPVVPAVVYDTRIPLLPEPPVPSNKTQPPDPEFRDKFGDY